MSSIVWTSESGWESAMTVTVVTRVLEKTCLWTCRVLETVFAAATEHGMWGGGSCMFFEGATASVSTSVSVDGWAAPSSKESG